MSIPDPSTTITVMRPRTPASDPDYTTSPPDPWDPDAGDVGVLRNPDPVYSGIPATFGKYRGSVTADGSSQSDLRAEMVCDPIDLRLEDTVVDDTTGDVWKLAWVILQGQADGMEEAHIRAQVVKVTGAV